MAENSTKVIIHAEEPAPLIEQLRVAHPNTKIESCDNYQSLPAKIEDFKPDAVYTIRFAGSKDFPTNALLGEHGPKWICVGGSGVDHLGVWNTEETLVTNSAGVAAGMMAEYAFGSFLHFSLNIPGLDTDKKQKVWRPRTVSPLRGTTLLIIGLGNTGRAAAKMAKAFGMRVLGTRASSKQTEYVDEVFTSSDLGKLYPRADFILVCAPLLDSTKELVNEGAFAAMKPGAVLVDVSRGGIVKSAPLIKSLENGHLKGAALDVFETEPLPADHDLWNMPNLIMSPHCSSVFENWERGSMEMFCENLTRFNAGETLHNLVDPQRGY